jgi:Methyltransferase domain/C-methyltransferase C-terminal domain
MVVRRHGAQRHSHRSAFSAVTCAMTTPLSRKFDLQPDAHVCPLCGGSGSNDFFHAANAPVTCASIFATREEALEVPSGVIDLTICRSCGFIFNRSFDADLGAAGAEYESSQAASAHFGAFAQSLAQEWVQRYELRGAGVLEVGCGGGDFLARLVQEGVARGYGVDPCCDPASTRDAIQFLREAFSAQHHTLSASALVCRHTLEHIKEVGSFVRLLHAWAATDSKRVVLIELPASERILRERAFWDVYYEHCNYFTLRTVRLAFETAGFEVLRLREAYDGQYILLEAVARQTAAQPAASDAGPDLHDADVFGRDVHRAIERCTERLARLATSGRPLVIWQGASKTVGFLAALADSSAVSCAVDLSPLRQGKFLPGSGLAVRAPEELVQLQPADVVLMNPVYLDEVRARLQALGVACRVHTVNDLLAE